MKKKYSFKKNKAGFISVSNIPSEKELEQIYRKLYFQNKKIRPKNYQKSYDSQEKKHIKLMNDLNIYAITKTKSKWDKNPGTMLEVGVGEGFMLARAKSKGWKICGIDYSKFGINKFNKKLSSYVEEGNPIEILEKYNSERKKFDVIIILNVLEHVIEPKKILSKLTNLLKKNGVIMITIPNDFSLLQKRALELGHIKNQFWIAAPQHLHYFNTKNIISFMKQMKFKILDMYTSFPIDFYLYHKNSNYIRSQQNGKLAHRARIELDLVLSNNGIDNFHKLCQMYAKCGIGRDITIIVKSQK